MGMRENSVLPVPKERRMIDVGDAQIACRIFGGGEQTLLLLHGNGEDYRAFRDQIDAFSKRFCVVALDSRGHGDSRSTGPVTISRMIEDTARVLDALGIERATVVGFSDGGNVAIGFALRYPERLDRLVLAGANLFPRGVKPAAQLPVEVQYYACRLLGKFSVNAQKKGEILGLMVREPAYTPAMLGKITAPTLVLAGENDLIKPEHTALIANSIPDARCLIIPNADHFIFLRQPVRVNAAILMFLTEQRKGDTNDYL